MNDEIRKIIAHMRALEKMLWAGGRVRLGSFAVARVLNAYASRLEIAIGNMPKSKGII